MKPWFDSDEKIDRLEAFATPPVIGTPWRNNSGEPGPRGGYACHRLIADALFAAGFVERFDVPGGNPRAMLIHGRNLIFGYIDANWPGHFARAGVETPPRPGDLVELETEKVRVHVGIVLRNNRFLHVLRFCGTTIHELGDPTWGGRVKAIRRPIYLNPNKE